MAEPVSGPEGEQRGGRRYRLEGALLQEGFTPLPNFVLRDDSLSGNAKALWALIYDLHHRGVDPELGEVGAMLGGGEKTARTAVKELKEGGYLRSIRRGQGLPNAYELLALDGPNSPKRSNKNGLEGRSRTALKAGLRAGAGKQGGKPKTKTLKALTPQTPLVPDVPPALVMVNKRNLAFDALMEECGIDPASPRMGQIVAGLNGKGKEQGIRDLFWVELQRWADESANQAVLEGVEGERFERALASAIRRKAALYRVKLRGAYLSPTALRDHWLDLELQRGADGRALTPREIAGLREEDL